MPGVEFEHLHVVDGLGSDSHATVLAAHNYCFLSVLVQAYGKEDDDREETHGETSEKRDAKEMEGEGERETEDDGDGNDVGKLAEDLVDSF